MVRDWAVPASKDATQALQASLSELASPISSPTTTVLLPIASRTGLTFSMRAASPETRGTRVPSSAGFFVPTTGESRKATPCWAASFAIVRTLCGPTVADCIQTAPAGIASRNSDATATVAAVSKRIVSTTSA